MNYLDGRKPFIRPERANVTYPTPPNPHKTAICTESGLATSLDSKVDISAVRPTKSGFRPIDTIQSTLSNELSFS